MQAYIKKNLGRAYYADGVTPTNTGGWLSKSMLYQFMKSPHKWMHGGGAIQPTDAMKLGTLVHAIALTPSTWEDDYAVCPYNDFRTKESKEWRDTAESSGKEVVKQAQVDQAQEIAASVMDSAHLFSLGTFDTEVAVYGEIAGCRVKGMVDIAPHNGTALADIKTCSSIGTERDLTNKIIGLAYHMQAALYSDLWAMATGRDIERFKFLFVETEAPYETAMVTLDGEWLKRGRDLYMNALSKWVECMALKMFPPQYPNEILLDFPSWA